MFNFTSLKFSSTQILFEIPISMYITSYVGSVPHLTDSGARSSKGLKLLRRGLFWRRPAHQQLAHYSSVKLSNKYRCEIISIPKNKTNFQIYIFKFLHLVLYDINPAWWSWWELYFETLFIIRKIEFQEFLGRCVNKRKKFAVDFFFSF